MRRQFKDTVNELAEKDNSIVLIFGDVSVYLFNDFKIKYPHRFYNMGICENTLISVGAGLSSQGFIPFIHTIAPFLTERSYEQIKLDLCYNRFPANIVTCGASFDYAWDGPTHHCYADIEILRLLPEIEILQPGSVKELDILMKSQYANDNSVYFRLSDNPHQIDVPVEFGKGVLIKDANSQLTIMTAGPIFENVYHAVNDLNVNIVYFHTIKPIDTKIINKFSHTDIIVINDAFGLYEAINEVQDLRTSNYGLQRRFFCCYGKLDHIRESIGLDTNSIREFIRNKMNCYN